MDFLIYFIISLVVIFIIYIVFTYISVKKQQRKFVEVQKEIKPKSEVVISGGIYGKVKTIDNNTARVEIAEGVVIKVERYAIQRVL